MCVCVFKCVCTCVFGERESERRTGVMWARHEDEVRCLAQPRGLGLEQGRQGIEVTCFVCLCVCVCVCVLGASCGGWDGMGCVGRHVAARCLITDTHTHLDTHLDTYTYVRTDELLHALVSVGDWLGREVAHKDEEQAGAVVLTDGFIGREERLCV